METDDMTRRGIARILIGIILLSTVSSCGREPIRLGLIASFSGPFPESGVRARRGVLLAVEAVNADGGVNGRQVVLLVKDDAGSPETARKSAHELADARVQAIIGPFFSFLLEDTLEVCEKERILLFSPTIISSRFEYKDDMFFRLYHSAVENGGSYAGRIVSARGFTRVAMISDSSNTIYASEWKLGFMDRFSALGGRLTNALDFNPEIETAMKPTAQRALEPAPDAVVLVMNGLNGALMAQQLRKLNPSIPLFASEWSSTSPELYTLGGSAINGMEVRLIFDEHCGKREYIDFKKSFFDRFAEEPELDGLLAYETARIILQGIRKRQKDEALKEAILEGSPYEGLQWEITMDAFGDGRHATFFSRILSGRFAAAP